MDIRRIIKEELTDEQKKTVNNWVRDKAISTHDASLKKFGDLLNGSPKGRVPDISSFTPHPDYISPAEKISGHVIPHGEHKVIIPLHKNSTMTPLEPHSFVKSVLGTVDHSTTPELYSKGLATDKYGREVKIGKVFAKARTNPERDDDIIAIAEKKHNEAMNSRSKQSFNSHQIVISRHPHDVAGMSTDRGWTSCMNMDGGIYREHLENDVHEGTHVAYLTKHGDDDIKNPVARIAIKPYSASHSDGGIVHTVIRSDPEVYGTAPAAFKSTVEAWTEKHFPLKDEHLVYTKHPDTYDDGKDTVLNDRAILKDPKKALDNNDFNYSGNAIHSLSHEAKQALLHHAKARKFNGLNYVITNNLVFEDLKANPEHVTHYIQPHTISHVPTNFLIDHYNAVDKKSRNNIIDNLSRSNDYHQSLLHSSIILKQTGLPTLSNEHISKLLSHPKIPSWKKVSMSKMFVDISTPHEHSEMTDFAIKHHNTRVLSEISSISYDPNVHKKISNYVLKVNIGYGADSFDILYNNHSFYKKHQIKTPESEKIKQKYEDLYKYG